MISRYSYFNQHHADPLQVSIFLSCRAGFGPSRLSSKDLSDLLLEDSQRSFHKQPTHGHHNTMPTEQQDHLYRLKANQTELPCSTYKTMAIISFPPVYCTKPHQKMQTNSNSKQHLFPPILTFVLSWKTNKQSKNNHINLTKTPPKPNPSIGTFCQSQRSSETRKHRRVERSDTTRRSKRPRRRPTKLPGVGGLVESQVGFGWVFWEALKPIRFYRGWFLPWFLPWKLMVFRVFDGSLACCTGGLATVGKNMFFAGVYQAFKILLGQCARLTGLLVCLDFSPLGISEPPRSASMSFSEETSHFFSKVGERNLQRTGFF